MQKDLSLYLLLVLLLVCKEVNFLESVQKQNCCGTPSGVHFLATNIGPAHGDMLLWMVSASSQFYYLKKSHVA